MRQIELKEKRKEREKHFLQENGEIIAQVFDEDIHYLKNGKYEEIDNTLIKDKNCYCNRSNVFRTFFDDSGKDLMILKSNDNKIKMNLKDCNKIIPEKKEYSSKLYSSIFYKNIIDNIDLRYTLTPTKVKEEIILNDKNCIDKELVFVIQTDLELKINDDKTISVFDENENKFTLEVPFMIDFNNEINNNIYYELKKVDNNYELKLVLDKEWLNNENIKYPVVIDPTITNNGQNNSVYDTYIYSGDTNVTRYNKDILKVGVEKINGVDRVNRALLKFDLPEIGTGDQIVNATLNLIGYPLSDGPFYDRKIINVHQITEEWTESGANWETMSDKYNSRIENCFRSERSYKDENNNITPTISSCNLTNLVQKWYSDTPNYGIMLKLNNEIYTTSCLPSFYSKNNSVSGANPRPVLTIAYRNQNGVEKYMKYEYQQLCRGKIYENLYNGNLTAILNVGSTIDGKLPANLNLVYNTNDSILSKENGYGIGFKLDLHQTIREIEIDSTKYIEYEDGDGTLHYFKNQNNEYLDEDGLNLKIIKNDNYYLMLDSDGNKIKFVLHNDNIGYLEELIDLSDNKIIISYDSDNKIIKITDANNSEINLLYEENRISVISPSEIIILNYVNNYLMNIQFGEKVTSFLYNDKNIISSVTDENNIKFTYEYYEQKPYKIKKVTKYGTDNSEGDYFSIEYGFNTTKIIDNKEITEVITFNSYGNPNSKEYFARDNTLKGAYGKKEIYGENLNDKNKLVSSMLPEKHINNYIFDGNFYDDIPSFESDTTLVSLTDETSFSGGRCLKIENDGYNQRTTDITIAPHDDYYTFSCYLKNDNDVKIALSYNNGSNEEVIAESNIIKPKEDFEREEVTIYYPDSNNARSNLHVVIISLTPGIVYIDNAQLEVGEVANDYNYVSNSNFFNGLGTWHMETGVNFELGENTDMTEFESNVFETVEVEPGLNALKVKMNPRLETKLVQKFYINGKTGDTYSMSFWYKNGGVSPLNSEYNNYANLTFLYNDEDEEENTIIKEQLNSNCEEWQYYRISFTAQEDFSVIKLSFTQIFNANEFYLTNIMINKGLSNVECEYDDNGNLISLKKNGDKLNLFSYDNNQLIKITNPMGKDFVYEYDRIIKNRVINGISPLGICNQIKYDENENPVTTKIVNYAQNKSISNGLYKIRLKGTNKYLKNINNYIRVHEETCCHNKWYIEQENDNYKIKHSITNNKYVSIQGEKVILSNENDNSSLFSLIKKANGSYLIKLSEEDKYLKYNGAIGLDISELQEDNCDFEFLFESEEEKYFIEQNAEYNSDGRFVSKIVDCNLNTFIYENDEVSGLVTKYVTPNNIPTEYIYNEKNQLIKIKYKDKEILYSYNEYDLIDKVKFNNKEYNFLYNEFLNIKQIKIGEDIVLLNNNYEEQNGNLLSYGYGNEDFIEIFYDELDRIKTVKKMDDTYEYKYGNNGDLLKVISSNKTISYMYDMSKRLTEYKVNDFRIRYRYDDNDNIVQQCYMLEDNLNIINNTFNEDDAITKVQFNNETINYTYDSLGRISSKNINNNNNINYFYLSNGNRTTFLIDKVINNTNMTKYRYNEFNNITHIFYNDKLLHKYFYDDYNQLIKEIDYLKNITIKYRYDNSGNLLNKSCYKLNDNSFLYQNKYEYSNENWEDQLTKFNDEMITYDAIGNPLTIGNKLFTWINGRELKNCIIEDKEINYKYNKEGIRISKTINNVTTEYFVDDEDIIYEKTNNDLLFYIRNDDGELEAIKYNNNLYYYIKNIQNDIIGLMDNNYNQIVKYEYDSWGNIISIKDSIGNEITDNNHIAYINPYRYRSYYYDNETGLYYLNSRYYNPVWGRFINADGYISTGQGIMGYNMYIYCGNNPINNSDGSGKIFKKIIRKAKKRVKKVVKKVKKIVKKVAKKAKTKIKKAIIRVATETVDSLADTFNTNKKTFTAEVGYGYGLTFSTKINGSKVKAGNSARKSIKIKNGTIKKTLSINSNSSSVIGGSQSKEIDCDKMEICSIDALIEGENTGQIDLTTIESLDLPYFSIDNQANIFIGFDVELYIIGGFHFKVGWEVDDLHNIIYGEEE